MIKYGLGRGKSQGCWPHFTVYHDLSPNTETIPFLTMIYFVFFSSVFKVSPLHKNGSTF